MHDRGVVTSEPGLYFVGLAFQVAVAPDGLRGVGRDASHVVKRLLARERTARPVGGPPPRDTPGGLDPEPAAGRD